MPVELALDLDKPLVETDDLDTGAVVDVLPVVVIVEEGCFELVVVFKVFVLDFEVAIDELLIDAEVLGAADEVLVADWVVVGAVEVEMTFVDVATEALVVVALPDEVDEAFDVDEALAEEDVARVDVLLEAFVEPEVETDLVAEVVTSEDDFKAEEVVALVVADDALDEVGAVPVLILPVELDETLVDTPVCVVDEIPRVLVVTLLDEMADLLVETFEPVEVLLLAEERVVFPVERAVVDEGFTDVDVAFVVDKADDLVDDAAEPLVLIEEVVADFEVADADFVVLTTDDCEDLIVVPTLEVTPFEVVTDADLVDEGTDDEDLAVVTTLEVIPLEVVAEALLVDDLPVEITLDVTPLEVVADADLVDEGTEDCDDFPVETTLDVTPLEVVAEALFVDDDRIDDSEVLTVVIVLDVMPLEVLTEADLVDEPAVDCEDLAVVPTLVVTPLEVVADLVLCTEFVVLFED
ncbi:hypothetical protein LTR84_010478 [Exophiala bonariae]|uniref:ATPase n=1 Tax=Exophiala bonariae TaxID=1690606 RepID=A0AAV9MVZ6_9EURO|nr:hypothetical protein LTR84_010478 [Exophiala bonariae]